MWGSTTRSYIVHLMAALHIFIKLPAELASCDVTKQCLCGWWDKLQVWWALTVVGDGVSEIILNGKYTISFPFKFELLY